jgi:hypothetical protein
MENTNPERRIEKALFCLKGGTMRASLRSARVTLPPMGARIGLAQSGRMRGAFAIERIGVDFRGELTRDFH